MANESAQKRVSPWGLCPAELTRHRTGSYLWL